MGSRSVETSIYFLYFQAQTEHNTQKSQCTGGQDKSNFAWGHLTESLSFQRHELQNLRDQSVQEYIQKSCILDRQIKKEKRKGGRQPREDPSTFLLFFWNAEWGRTTRGKGKKKRDQEVCLATLPFYQAHKGTSKKSGRKRERRQATNQCSKKIHLLTFFQ